MPPDDTTNDKLDRILERVGCVETGQARLEERIRALSERVATQDRTTQLNAARIFDLAIKVAEGVALVVVLAKIGGIW